MFDFKSEDQIDTNRCSATRVQVQKKRCNEINLK